MREWILLSWRIQMTDELVEFLLALVRAPMNIVLKLIEAIALV